MSSIGLLALTLKKRRDKIISQTFIEEGIGSDIEKIAVDCETIISPAGDETLMYKGKPLLTFLKFKVERVTTKDGVEDSFIQQYYKHGEIKVTICESFDSLENEDEFKNPKTKTNQ